MKLTVAMYAVLKEIAREGPKERWPNNSSLAALERRGLVTSERSKSNPHFAVWSATEVGRKMVERH